MRVAIDVTAVPDQPAGAGRYVVRLVEALARRDDVDLVLVSRRADGTRWRELAPAADVTAVAPVARPLRLAWEQTAAPMVGRRMSAEVWHGPHYTMPLVGGLPTVVTIHDLTLMEHPEWHEGAKARFFPAMIRASSRRAGALVCVSQGTADRLVELVHPEVPVVVAPHGVDTDVFTATPVDGELDRLAALGVRAPFVAFVGTIEPRKNLPALVRAVAGLDGVQLVIAGQDGWGTAQLDQAIDEAGMQARVLRLGFVDDGIVAALYRHADAVAYVPFEEGFGLPALEAVACGGALVTTAGSVMEDLVGGSALLVPAGDHGALAAALAGAIAGGPAIAAQRAAGPGVAAGHSWAASAERHVAAYRLALDR